MPPFHHRCQACDRNRLYEIAGFRHLPRVTSDSKPFREGGRLFVCKHCGTAQKIADPKWLRDIGEIYLNYEMYHQSASNDQAVFDPVSGRPSGRCEVLVQRLLESGLPRSGTLLDIGTGSGAMLAAFSAACNEWRLYGLDLDERKRQALSAIPRFEKLFTGPPSQLLQRFDLVSLIHSLEHFVDPSAMLRALREKIAPGGRLFIQVNNVDRMPFDLVVADHLCHFSPCSLAYLVARAGFRIDAVRTDWINKEISLLAGSGVQPQRPTHEDSRAVVVKIESEVAWLNSMLEHGRKSARSGRFGIFGTSVAATWLAGGLGDCVAFFVDEDPARQGRSHLGRPILRPAQIPAESVVYLAFVPEVSAAVSRRLAHLPVKFAAPPRAAL